VPARHVERRVQRIDAHEAQDGPEDLLARDRHLRRDAVEDRRPEEPALLRHVRLAAVERDLGAFLDALRDVREDAPAMVLGDERTHLRAARRAVADPQRARAVDEAVAQPSVAVADRQDDRSRQAALPGAAEGRLEDRAERALPVRVGHHDEEVLRAAERLDALPVEGRGAVHVLRHGARADEGDAADERVREQRVDRLLPAVHEVQDAGREARVVDQLEDELLAEGDLLAGLADERVPARDGERHEPQRHHRREVERRDAREDAERLAEARAVDPARDVLEDLALEQRGRARGDLDALDPAPDAPARLLDRLAVLARDRARELLGVAVEQVLQLEEAPRALDGRHRAPLGEGAVRQRRRAVDVDRAAERREADDLAGRGVAHLARLARERGDPLAADVVLGALDGHPPML
jgi:hypothetical protein